MKWFKHDSNANTDAKMKRLRHKYGIQAYGLYWYCLELIAGRVDKKNITFKLEEDAEIIALEWGMDRLKVQEMMEYMVNLGLFESNMGTVTCLKLAKRLDDTNAKNPQIKQLIDDINNQNSDSFGEIPSKSDGLRPDEIRLDKNKTFLSKPSVSDPPDEGEDSTPENDDDEKIPNCDHSAVIDLYHKTLPELQAVNKSLWIDSERADNLRARWKQNAEFRKLEFWEWYFQKIRSSPFHMGENNREWKADLGWLVKRSNFSKLVEKFSNV